MAHRWLLGSTLLLTTATLFTSCAGPAPLMLSSRAGDTQDVTAQLDAGADVNMQDADGVTPLMTAAGHGGADLTAGSRGELTYKDLKDSHATLDTVKLLLSRGAKVGMTDENGATALWYAAYHGNSEIITVLLAAGAAPDRANNDGETPLQMAAKEGHEACVAVLLRETVNVNSRAAESGKTPLMTASYVGAEGCVRLLLGASADSSLVDAAGRSALWEACFKGHMAVVKQLLLHGAPLDTRAKDGSTPLGAALQQNHDTIAKVLRQEGAVE